MFKLVDSNYEKYAFKRHDMKTSEKPCAFGWGGPNRICLAHVWSNYGILQGTFRPARWVNVTEATDSGELPAGQVELRFSFEDIFYRIPTHIFMLLMTHLALRVDLFSASEDQWKKLEKPTIFYSTNLRKSIGRGKISKLFLSRRPNDSVCWRNFKLFCFTPIN